MRCITCNLPIGAEFGLGRCFHDGAHSLKHLAKEFVSADSTDWKRDEAPIPPEGCRILNKYERILETDCVWNGNVWVKNSGKLSATKIAGSRFRYARKIGSSHTLQLQEKVLDDLERVHCEKVGILGHSSCGICPCGKPRFTCTEHFYYRIDEIKIK